MLNLMADFSARVSRLVPQPAPNPDFWRASTLAAVIIKIQQTGMAGSPAKGSLFVYMDRSVTGSPQPDGRALDPGVHVKGIHLNEPE
jgi:hypothetical protein